MSSETEIVQGGPGAQPETRFRVAYVYRTFSEVGSIPSLYRRLAERLSYDLDLTLFCSVRGRESTDAPLTFHNVDPLVEGSGRFRYAIECATFAARATRAASQTRRTFDVVHSEGFATLRADLVTVHAVRAAEIERYFERIEPHAGVRRILSPYVFRPQAAVVLAIERRLYARPAPLCIAPSLQIKGDLERFHGVPSELIEVIPYGIDDDRFRFDASAREQKRAELNVPEDTTVVLFVGDQFQRKGLDTAIRGWLQAARVRISGWSAATTQRSMRRSRLGSASPNVSVSSDVFPMPSYPLCTRLPTCYCFRAGTTPGDSPPSNP